jgi:hypothetical protein
MPKSKKPRTPPGLSLLETLERKLVFRDDWRSRVEDVVHAHPDGVDIGIAGRKIGVAGGASSQFCTCQL